MSSSESLGGRLALVHPADLSAEQRRLYDQLQATEVPWAQQAGFESQTAAHELIGPYNAMLRSPAIATAMLGTISALSQHSTLSEPVRQVVILTVGATWQAAYEVYAHAAVARKAGLPEVAIQQFLAGQPPLDLPPTESLAYELTQQLVTTHQVAPGLYERARAVFSEQGVFDLVALAGQYLLVSALLNTFAVPAPSTPAA